MISQQIWGTKYRLKGEGEKPIEHYMIDIGFLTPGGKQRTGTETQRLAVGEPRALTPSVFRQCPKCGAAALIRRETATSALPANTKNAGEPRGRATLLECGPH